MVEQLPRLDYSNNLQDGCTIIHKKPRTTLYLPFLKPKTKSRKNLWEKKKKSKGAKQRENESRAKSSREIKGLFGL